MISHQTSQKDCGEATQSLLPGSARVNPRVLRTHLRWPGEGGRGFKQNRGGRLTGGKSLGFWMALQGGKVGVFIIDSASYREHPIAGI